MKEKKRLNLNIDKELHDKLKIIAIDKNITLSLLVERELVKLVKLEEKYNK